MKPVRVLVVEDETDVLETLVELLQRRGFEVTSAVDGHDALTSGKIDEIDVVVTDVRMPRVDGIELYRQACVLRPEVPFIFVSGHVIELRDLPNSGHCQPPVLLHKPFDIAILVETIKQQLQKIL